MESENDNFFLPVFVLHPVGVDLIGIEREFENKNEFSLCFISLETQVEAGLSVWGGFVKAAEIALANDDEVLIICTEKHRFAPDYQWTEMLDDILACRKKGAEVILFNIGAFDQAVQVKGNIFWINHFISFDFIVIFRELIERIAVTNFETTDTVERKIVSLTSYAFTVYPFQSHPLDRHLVGGALLERIRRSTRDRFELIRFVKSRFASEDSGARMPVPPEFAQSYSQDYSAYVAAMEHYLSLSKPTSANVKFIRHLRTNIITDNQSRMVLLVPFHNVEKYLEECIDSIFGQEYENFIVIFLDDCSSDGSLAKIPDIPNCFTISANRRLYALENLYSCLTSFNLADEDIVVIVDGDDFLRHNQVLKRLNRIYKQHHCEVSYGQYCSTDNQRGHCRPYSRNEFENLRSLDWRASHLKSFKYSLFKRLASLDPQMDCFRDDDGSFFKMTYDVALMTPLMEVAGYEKVYFNPDILYVYRRHENNDAVQDLGLQSSIAEKIKSMRSFVAPQLSNI